MAIFPCACQRIAPAWRKIYDALNDIFQQNEKMTEEFGRISNAAAKKADYAARGSIAKGGYAACVESVNSLITDLVQPSTEVARVIGAWLRAT